jgi:hypothetical protein
MTTLQLNHRNHQADSLAEDHEHNQEPSRHRDRAVGCGNHPGRRMDAPTTATTSPGLIRAAGVTAHSFARLDDPQGQDTQRHGNRQQNPGIEPHQPPR